MLAALFSYIETLLERAAARRSILRLYRCSVFIAGNSFMGSN